MKSDRSFVMRWLLVLAMPVIGLPAALALAQDGNDNSDGDSGGEVSTTQPIAESFETVTVGTESIRRFKEGFRNLGPADVLRLLDIDNDGLPDGSPDSDGDGLPDNWENGGFEEADVNGNEIDRVVFIPAPTAIVPGSPPTPVFARFKVTTSAFDVDTDDDGLTDFVEVFGLKFIDDNGNGVLDDGVEWADLNGDGLPSPGEYPIARDFLVIPVDGTLLALLHDFDGFVFTDPNNPDTDGDGVQDGEDQDPLINPRAFGIAGTGIVRFRQFTTQDETDIDFDGLENGMDMGNDLTDAESTGIATQVIDNPQNLSEILGLFRDDLRQQGVVPESTIEDILSLDWDGNGLWRTTDAKEWHAVIDDSDAGDSAGVPPADLFILQGRKLYANRTFEDLAGIVNAPAYSIYGSDLVGTNADSPQRLGLGWQELLRPSNATEFMPDLHIWALLYAWRMPGFDIDGDGFVGAPTLSATSSHDINGVESATVALVETEDGVELSETVPINSSNEAVFPFDDRIPFANNGMVSGDFSLDGRIQPPPGFPGLPLCGTMGGGALAMLLIGFVGLKRRRHGRRA